MFGLMPRVASIPRAGGMTRRKRYLVPLVLLLVCCGPSGDLHSRARQGDVKAQIELGERYWTGKDMPVDKDEARKWTQQAADQGSVRAQFMLGLMYSEGDLARAYMWWSVAASAPVPRAPRRLRYRSGYSVGAATALEGLQQHMTHEQIAEGQRLSGEWWAQHAGTQK